MRDKITIATFKKTDPTSKILVHMCFMNFPAAKLQIRLSKRFFVSSALLVYSATINPLYSKVQKQLWVILTSPPLSSPDSCPPLNLLGQSVIYNVSYKSVSTSLIRLSPANSYPVFHLTGAQKMAGAAASSTQSSGALQVGGVRCVPHRLLHHPSGGRKENAEAGGEFRCGRDTHNVSRSSAVSAHLCAPPTASLVLVHFNPKILVIAKRPPTVIFLSAY